MIGAQKVGSIVAAVDGSPLDMPLDAETPVGFVGFANRRTANRLRPHLREAMRELPSGQAHGSP